MRKCNFYRLNKHFRNLRIIYARSSKFMAFIKNHIGQTTIHLKLNKRQQLLLFHAPIDTRTPNVATKNV